MVVIRLFSFATAVACVEPTASACSWPQTSVFIAFSRRWRRELVMSLSDSIHFPRILIRIQWTKYFQLQRVTHYNFIGHIISPAHIIVCHPFHFVSASSSVYGLEISERTSSDTFVHCNRFESMTISAVGVSPSRRCFPSKLLPSGNLLAVAVCANFLIGSSPCHGLWLELKSTYKLHTLSADIAA